MLHPAFERFIKDLQTYCIAKHNYVDERTIFSNVYDNPRAILKKRWMLFKRVKGIIDIGNYDLDRQELNEDLFNIYTRGGKQGTLISDSVQMQFLQALERALIHRRLTPARALVHASVRYRAHAHQNGIFQDLLNQVKKLEEQSTSTTPAP